LYFRGIVESEDDAGPSTSGLSSSKIAAPVEAVPRTLSPIRKSKSGRLKKGKSTDKRFKEDKSSGKSNKSSNTLHSLFRKQQTVAQSTQFGSLFAESIGEFGRKRSE
jgi:hypothetical protein